MKHSLLLASLLLSLASASTFAQSDAATIQRDVNQQNRIEQGLTSGSLNTREAGRLEREESRIDRQQARDLRNGPLTARERAQLRREQNQASRDIKRLESNGLQGNPNSVSSERLQADVQRNATQEQRIENGVRNGQLNNRQVAALEAGQARVDRGEARAAHDGRVGGVEQARIQGMESRQGERIFKKKHVGDFK